MFVLQEIKGRDDLVACRITENGFEQILLIPEAHIAPHPSIEIVARAEDVVDVDDHSAPELRDNLEVLV